LAITYEKIAGGNKKGGWFLKPDTMTP